MDVVNSSVQRIDVPHMVIGACLFPALFRNNVVIWKVLVDVAEQELLRTAVYVAHQVDVAFMVYLQMLAEAGAKNLARLAGEGDQVSEGRRHSGLILAWSGANGKKGVKNFCGHEG